MRTSTPAALYARCCASATKRACVPHPTPSTRSGGFVWYPSSVSQMRTRDPNARRVSVRSRSSDAIEIVEQWSQPPADGDSAGDSGCGWCAYASSRAPARPMPRMKSTGDVPPGPPRGAVAPPAIDARGMTALIASAAGFSRRVT